MKLSLSALAFAGLTVFIVPHLGTWVRHQYGTPSTIDGDIFADVTNECVWYVYAPRTGAHKLH